MLTAEQKKAQGSRATVGENAPADPEAERIALDRSRPKSKRTQTVLDASAEYDGVKDQASGILDTVLAKLPELEGKLSEIRAQAALAQIAETRDVVRADLATVENRASTALQHIREMQARAIDLTKLVADLALHGDGLRTRAAERGYPETVKG